MDAAMKYPWMPLFWGDFLANTMHLSAQEAGAYLFLIAHAWEHEGQIPGDRIRLARIAHVRPDQWNKVWFALQNFFEIKAGVPSDGSTSVRWYTHHRVTDELRRLGKISNKRKEAAEQKHSNSFASAPANAPNVHRHPLPIPIENLSSGKEGEAPSVQVHVNWRDPGVEYRSPPRTKSDNVLEPTHLVAAKRSASEE